MAGDVAGPARRPPQYWPLLKRLMGIWVAIDHGQRRIGTAVADARGRIAFPNKILSATGSASGDARLILTWALAADAAGIVLGLPLNMDGSDSDQTLIVRRLAAELAAQTTLPIELWDERLTSFQADEHLAAAQVAPRRRKGLRDALAAQVILQSFLDARRPPATQSAAPAD